jgi:hypothetical protein
MRGFINWAARQMLAVRLYHPCWTASLAHGISTSAALFVAVALLLAATATRNPAAAGWLGGGLAFYFAMMAAMLVGMEAGMRRIVRFRAEPTDWIGWKTAVSLAGAFFWAHVVSAQVLLKAQTMRRVRWRGIEYEIDGPLRIRLVEYRPFDDHPRRLEANASL